MTWRFCEFDADVLDFSEFGFGLHIYEKKIFFFHLEKVVLNEPICEFTDFGVLRRPTHSGDLYFSKISKLISSTDQI